MNFRDILNKMKKVAKFDSKSERADRVYAQEVEKAIKDLGITNSDTDKDITKKLKEGAKKSPFIKDLLYKGKEKSPLLHSLYANANKTKKVAEFDSNGERADRNFAEKIAKQAVEGAKFDSTNKSPLLHQLHQQAKDKTFKAPSEENVYTTDTPIVGKTFKAPPAKNVYLKK